MKKRQVELKIQENANYISLVDSETGELIGDQISTEVSSSNERGVIVTVVLELPLMKQPLNS